MNGVSGKRRWLLLGGGVLALGVACSLHFWYRLYQNDKGICHVDGRVLAEEEHRKRTLQSLVSLEVENIWTNESKYNDGAAVVGVIPGGLKSDVPSIMALSVQNEESFEANFGIEVVPFQESGPAIVAPEEPYTLVVYDRGVGGRAGFTDSKSVVRALVHVVGEDEVGLLDRYRGYGNYFYRVNNVLISRECCDARKGSMTREEYISRKYRFYKESLETFRLGWADFYQIAVVSNCGELLLVDSENGINDKSVKWLKGVY
ncbi:hypothetical protein [Pseudomonas sp. TUM22785]|uniref:hypothetical protein n=1 Tax=Pseudomonas sp. TUM22785 TaxID=3019098 RepID=UPI002305676A|nr:hypothetical protein [Pseudomonas sp. TUM22785]WCD83184.1 hypothetical protein PI990_14510 [Pseudomonas sp. TUM22785]